MGVEQQNHHKDQKEITQRFGLFVKFVKGQKPLPLDDVSETRKTIGIEIICSMRKDLITGIEIVPPLVLTPPIKKRE